MPELRRPIVAVCMYMKSSFKRDAAACPADCCPSAACFLPGAARCPSPAARRLLPAFCCVPPAARRLSSVRQVAPACRFAWRAALSGISGIAAPALFPAPSVVPAFPLSPTPSRTGRSEKVTAHPDNGCAADGEYACRYSGSFPVPQRVLGSGPSHSSSRPPRANSSCGNQKLLSTRPLRRARWI